MSEATIIIESAEKGGSLVTADIANSYSRDVFAVPGRSTDLYSKGCNDLIKNNKAAILTSAKDLIVMLNWESPNTAKKPIQKQLFVELTENEQLLYDFLTGNGKELIDLISLNCKLPIHQTTSLLFNLEMKGMVKPLPGKLYEAI
jgi:DNA processing protein